MLSLFVALDLQTLLPSTVSVGVLAAATSAALDFLFFCKLIGRRLGVVKNLGESSPVYHHHSGGPFS